jgi:hypothetical protein
MRREIATPIIVAIRDRGYMPLSQLSPDAMNVVRLLMLPETVTHADRLHTGLPMAPDQMITIQDGVPRHE